MVEQSSFTRLDRDLLIRLDTKVDAITQQVKDLADGTQMRLSKLEAKHETDMAKSYARLDAIDLYHAKIDLNRYEGLASWVSNFRANVALIYGVLVFFSGLITAFMLWLIQMIFKVKF